MTRTDPSRLTVQQTLGGAWADNFGPGVPTININGHTGWRGSGLLGDGLELFQELRDTVFNQWHAARKAAIAAGKDPDLVKLVFVDALDDFVSTVAPLNFTLRRSKARPLLAMYQISMICVGDGAVAASADDPLALAYDTTGTTQSLGLASLADSTSSITSYMGSASSFLPVSVLGPSLGFMGMSSSLFSGVGSAITDAAPWANDVASFAGGVAQAGMNAFRTLASVLSLSYSAVRQVAAIARAFMNIYCTLKNAINQLRDWQDFSSIFGASNCSSTAGGRPLSSFIGSNPFAAAFAATAAVPIAINTAAIGGLNLLAGVDAVTTTLSSASIASSMSAISGGLTLAL